MEIISGVERHRRWRLEDKLRIVAEAEAPGAVFALVARRHEVSRGQLWKWRTQVRSGELAAAQPVPEFIPVRMMPGVTGSLQRTTDVAAPMNTPDSQAGRPPTRPGELGANRIEIVLPDGTCVRVDNQVGAAALRQVIAVLRG
jgi:transposase